MSFWPTIITILLSGISAAFLTHLFTQRRADREYRLKKLEELCLALDAHANWVIQWLVATSAHDYSQGPAPNPGEDAKNYNTLTMLTHIYFPSLIPALQKLETIKIEA